MKKINEIRRNLKLWMKEPIQKFFIQHKGFWLGILILAVTVAGVSILWITFNEVSLYQPNNTASGTFQLNSEELIGLTMKLPGTKHGEYWKLNCAKMINSNETGTLSSISGDYYSVEKKAIYHLTAKSGRIIWNQSTIWFNGGVTLTMNHDTELLAENLTLNSKTDTIEASNNVILKNKSMEARTNHVQADLSLNKVNFKGMTTVSYSNL